MTLISKFAFYWTIKMTKLLKGKKLENQNDVVVSTKSVGRNDKVLNMSFNIWNVVNLKRNSR